MAGSAQRTTFDDYDAFGAPYSAGGRIVPMASAPWRATLSSAALGAIQLLHLEAPAQIRQGAVAAGDILRTSRAPPGAIALCGHAFEVGDISLVSAGAAIDARFLQPLAWSGVQFEAGALARLAEDWQPRLPGPGQRGIIRASLVERDRLLGAIEACIGEALHTPDMLTHPVAAAAVADSATHAVLRALADPGQWIAQPRATGARHRVARAAVEMLAASPAEGWTLSGLAERLGIAPRTLHGAFAAVYGCSPYAFIKRWRLMMVRRALQAQGEAMLVKTAALDHGFWHLGHFSVDYRAVFGESPQETRRKASRRRALH